MIPGLIRRSFDFERQRERESSSRYLITKVKNNSLFFIKFFYKVFYAFGKGGSIDFKLSNMPARDEQMSFLDISIKL